MKTQAMAKQIHMNKNDPNLSKIIVGKNWIKIDQYKTKCALQLVLESPTLNPNKYSIANPIPTQTI